MVKTYLLLCRGAHGLEGVGVRLAGRGKAAAVAALAHGLECVQVRATASC